MGEPDWTHEVLRRWWAGCSEETKRRLAEFDVSTWSPVYVYSIVHGWDSCSVDAARLRDLIDAELREGKGAQRKALDLAVRFGGIDGDHHKAWVIDQMVRALAGDGYDQLVAEAKAGEDGPETYGWDEGIAP
jgi:hypothetical protein